jgi:hypothetical protein
MCRQGMHVGYLKLGCKVLTLAIFSVRSHDTVLNVDRFLKLSFRVTGSIKYLDLTSLMDVCISLELFYKSILHFGFYFIFTSFATTRQNHYIILSNKFY